MQGMKNPFSEELSKSSDYLAPATVRGRLYDVRGEYPCAVSSSDPADLIHGEIYRLNNPEKLFKTLDSYEDCYPEDPLLSLYIRTITMANTKDNKEHAVWIYLWNKTLDGLTHITSGDYRSC